jgi:hypothetical protein
MARKPDPKSKAGFVRSLPTSLSAAEVIKRGKAEGHKLSASYVYTVRAAMNRGARKKGAAPSAAAPRAGAAHAPRAARATGSGFEAAIEAFVVDVVDRRVAEILKSKLGSLI